MSRVPTMCPGRLGQKRTFRSAVDFARVASVARSHALAVCQRLLPGGRVVGGEYLALNPKRDDCSLGSFRVNLRTGRWADFANGERGGDLISLAAFLFDLSQAEAARRLADLLAIGSEVSR